MQQIIGINPGVRAWTIGYVPVQVSVPAVQTYNQVLVTSAGADTIIYSQPVIHIVQPAIVVENQIPANQPNLIQYQCCNPTAPQQYQATQNNIQIPNTYPNIVNQANDPIRDVNNENRNINQTSTYTLHQTVSTQTAPIVTNPTTNGRSTTQLRQTTVRANITATRVVTQPPGMPASQIPSNNTRIYENQPSTHQIPANHTRIYENQPSTHQIPANHTRIYENQPSTRQIPANHTLIYENQPSTRQIPANHTRIYENQPSTHQIPSNHTPIYENQPSTHPFQIQGEVAHARYVGLNNNDQGPMHRNNLHENVPLPISVKRKRSHFVTSNMRAETEIITRYLNECNSMENGDNLNEPNPSATSDSNVIQTNIENSFQNETVINMLPVNQPHQVSQTTNNMNVASGSQNIMNNNVRVCDMNLSTLDSNQNSIHQNIPNQILSNPNISSQTPPHPLLRTYIADRVSRSRSLCQKWLFNKHNLIDTNPTPSEVFDFPANAEKNIAPEFGLGGLVHNQLPVNQPQHQLSQNEIQPSENITNLNNVDQHTNQPNFYQTKPCANVLPNDLNQNKNGDRIRLFVNKVIGNGQPTDQIQNQGIVENIVSCKPQVRYTASCKQATNQDITENNQNLANNQNINDENRKLAINQNLNTITQKSANDQLNGKNQRGTLERGREVTASIHVNNQATLPNGLNNQTKSDQTSVVQKNTKDPPSLEQCAHNDTTVMVRSKSTDSDAIASKDRRGSVVTMGEKVDLGENRCHTTQKTVFKCPEPTFRFHAETVSNVGMSFATNPASLPENVATSTPKNKQPVNKVVSLQHFEAETLCSSPKSDNLPKRSSENRVRILNNEVFDYGKFCLINQSKCSTQNKTINDQSHEAHSSINIAVTSGNIREKAESVENQTHPKKRRVEPIIRQESSNMSKRDSNERTGAKKVVNNLGQISSMSKNISKHSINSLRKSAILNDIQSRNANRQSFVADNSQQLDNDIEMSYERGTAEVSSKKTVNQGVQTEVDPDKVRLELLTHVLGGHIIQESNVAFPIRHPTIRSPDFSTRHAGVLRRRRLIERQNPTQRLVHTAPANNIRALKAMSERDVYRWLCAHDCKEVAEILLEHEVDGEALTLASVRDLSGIGLPWVDALVLHEITSARVNM